MIDSVIDAAFRKALLDGVPASLRPKMKEALSGIVHADAMAHSVRYFGDELPHIKNHIAPLVEQLNRTLSESFNLPGLYDWLNATNFGNSYKMIKVFAAWAEMKNTPSIGIVRAANG